MSNLLDHAERELSHIGLDDEDGMNKAMCKHILHMVKEFSKEGHSGFSAMYAINCIEKLLRYEPLTPLTGEDWEWNDVSEMHGTTLYQNTRCSHVFKDDDGAYDIDGKVFKERRIDRETGEEYTTSYTSMDSRVPVVFPYVPKTEYVDMGFVQDE